MENKLKTYRKNEIKANIANGISKFRRQFWNDGIKKYSGHVVNSSETRQNLEFKIFES